MYNKLLNWFVYSSTNSKEISMSLQGLLIANIGIIMWVLHYFAVPYSVEQVTQIIGVLCGTIGALFSLVGLSRKLWYLLKGK